MKSHTMIPYTTARRRFLTWIGAGAAGAVVGMGTAIGKGRGFPPEEHTEWSDETGDLNDDATDDTRAFVTTNPSGKPTFVGVEIDAAALQNLPDGDGDLHTPERHLHLDVPESNTPFTFAGMEWNADGHPPEGIYDTPHFDVHFYMLEHSVVEAIEEGPAMYDIPENQLPAGYERLPVIDTDDDGEPDAPVVDPQMGEHLVDPSGSEFDGEFTHTHIWGAWDPDGDGRGELIFYEPMFTRELLLERRDEVGAEIGLPDAFPAEGWYPTEYVIRYLGNRDAYVVTLESFEQFPASDGC